MASAKNVTLYLEGRITAHTARSIWRSALETLASHPDRPIVIDTARLEYVAGIAAVAKDISGIAE